MIYDHIKNLKPFSIAKKVRPEGNFLIAMSDDINIYYLNSVAADIYSLCNGDRSIENIFDHMLNEYDVQSEMLKSDIVRLIRDLQWNKIIGLME
jgi:hypothetical protein